MRFLRILALIAFGMVYIPFVALCLIVELISSIYHVIKGNATFKEYWTKVFIEIRAGLGDAKDEIYQYRD